MPSLLIVDDEQSICWGLSQIGTDLGFDVATAATAEKAMALATDRKFDAICLDVRLPGMSGLEAIPGFRKIDRSVPIIVMTAFGDLKTAVEAVRQGAFEYIVKPFEAARVREVLTRVLAIENSASPSPTNNATDDFLIGESPEMQQVFARVALAASSDANVLIQGESGTGKELIARAIHQFSPRSSRPFVVVNLAALSSTLAESELFGHVRGAFTGAENGRIGLLQQANGGTLFLDEVAEIPLATQVKLLRAIEDRHVTPVGSSQSVAADFRIVAASHRNIEQLVQRSEFRHDLFFRLSSFQIALPSLRERKSDIPLLANRFLGGFSKSSTHAISEEAERELCRRPWRGNVRELRNAIEHAVIVSRGSTITPEHFPAPLQSIDGEPKNQSVTDAIQDLLRQWALMQIADPGSEGLIYERLLELTELPVFQTLMKETQGQLSRTATLLGLHRTTLRKKLDQIQPDSDS